MEKFSLDDFRKASKDKTDKIGDLIKTKGNYFEEDVKNCNKVCEDLASSDLPDEEKNRLRRYIEAMMDKLERAYEEKVVADIENLKKELNEIDEAIEDRSEQHRKAARELESIQIRSKIDSSDISKAVIEEQRTASQYSALSEKQKSELKLKMDELQRQRNEIIKKELQ